MTNSVMTHEAIQIRSNAIRQKALELGFTACGMAKAGPLHEYRSRMDSWLGQGHHATMGYMERNQDKRLNPALLVPGASTVIALAVNYFPGQGQHPDARYRISKYAYGLDYHVVIKKKLFALLDFIREQSENPVQARVFTDSAPVLEKAWAQKAGIGATGKNSCLIIPGTGSYVFLAEIIINLELPVDTPFDKDLCGSCTRCMKACPTQAITAPGVIDSSRCLSYLTIERKEEIPEAFAGKCQQWIFGCDICQDVCPYNKVAQPHREPELQPLPYVAWSHEQWENLTPEIYHKEIKKSGSPLSRVSFEKLTSNITLNQKG
ncbi:MAG: tRNA epoxyqueuosine(34) reductase QueG [Bacteroidales bacterium]